MSNLVEKVTKLASDECHKTVHYPEEFAKVVIAIVRNATLEEAATAIRHECGMCSGTGFADQSGDVECEYCGRPLAAIRALATHSGDGEGKKL